MKKHVLFIATAAAMLAGCAKEVEKPVEEQTMKLYTITALVDNPETRTVTQYNSETNKYKFSWSENETISVVSVNPSEILPFQVSNTASGIFTYESNKTYDGFGMAVTPADALVGNPTPSNFTVQLSGTYNYGQSNALMIAGEPNKNGDNYKFQFKHAAALVQVTYNDIPAGTKAMVLTATETEKVITGSANLTSATAPVAMSSLTGTTSNEARVNYASALTSAKSSDVFYVPIPTGSYQTFEIKLVDGSDHEISGSKFVIDAGASVNVTVGNVLMFPAKTVTSSQLIPDGVYAIALMNESNLNEDIMMTANVDGNYQLYSTLGTTYTSGKLSIPAASAWRISYDANNSTYSIQSMSNEKYLSGSVSNSNLTLNTAANKAQFSITEQGLEGDNTVYHISVHSASDERWIGFNYNGGTKPRFALYKEDKYPGKLRIIPAAAIAQTPSLTFTSTSQTVTATLPSAIFSFNAQNLITNPTVVVTTDEDEIISSATVNTNNNQVVVNLNTNTEFRAKTATLTVSCEGVDDVVLTIIQDGKSDVVEDVITKAFTAIPNTSYNTWSGKQGTSGAVYAGYSAGTNNSVQLKSDDNISGIVTTTSGGKIKTITVVWESHTQSERTLNVYGKNSAYSSAADLYNASNQGTLLGTIVMGSSTTLSVSGDYEYIGLRSASGAMFLSEIRIGWDTGSGPAPTTYAVSWTTPTETGCTISASVNGNSIQSGSSFAQGTEVSITATPGNGYTFSEWSINGANVASTTSATTTFTVGTSPVSFSASFTPNGGGDTGEPITLFHETFGNNPNSARAWSDSYSEKSGVASVYSGISSYIVVNAKQSKNTMGSTLSGLNQSTQGTDASIIIGPLNVSSYSNLALVYQWKAASVKESYHTKLFYATSENGSYTEVSGTGDGATTFVERSYSLPDNAQVSTLYLKIVWNTSNSQAAIDEVDLSGESTN